VKITVKPWMRKAHTMSIGERERVEVETDRFGRTIIQWNRIIAGRLYVFTGVRDSGRVVVYVAPPLGADQLATWRRIPMN
jgi:hypothetical protein